MSKIIVFVLLFISYCTYSIFVFTNGTKPGVSLAGGELALADKGKKMFQQYNCISCHQLYGLGGYLGPELTTAYSDRGRGELYMKTFLKAGGRRMPNFHFTDEEVAALVCYLKYVDATAVTYKRQ